MYWLLAGEAGRYMWVFIVDEWWWLFALCRTLGGSSAMRSASVGWTTSVCARRLITGGNQKWLGNFTICHLIHNPITIYHSIRKHFRFYHPKLKISFILCHSRLTPPISPFVRVLPDGWLDWREWYGTKKFTVSMFELSGKSCEGRWWQIVKFIWEALAAISVVTGNFLLE